MSDGRGLTRWIRDGCPPGDEVTKDPGVYEGQLRGFLEVLGERERQKAELRKHVKGHAGYGVTCAKVALWVELINMDAAAMSPADEALLRELSLDPVLGEVVSQAKLA